MANFSTVNLERLLASAKIVLAVNQTEIQPLLPQDKLHAYCTAKGIHQTAFGPLGGTGSTLHEEPAIVEIAKERGVATGNVMLSWGHRQRVECHSEKHKSRSNFRKSERQFRAYCRGDAADRCIGKDQGV